MHSALSIIVVAIETVGVSLLALEVWMGHKVEEIGESLAKLQRLQFLFTAEDYRGFWIDWRLQLGEPPAKVTEMVNLLDSTHLKTAVNDEWLRISYKVAEGYRRWERYTAPAARRKRKISLVTGTLLILAASWLTFVRESVWSPTSTDHAASAIADMDPAISLTRVQLSPFNSGLAEDSSPRLVSEVCRLRMNQGSSGSGVALVIGHHDPRPLTSAAKRRFGSNLGLAQERAETVARLLFDATTCPDAPPIDAIALAVPNDRSDPSSASASSILDEDRRPEVLPLQVVRLPKRRGP